MVYHLAVFAKGSKRQVWLGSEMWMPKTDNAMPYIGSRTLTNGLISVCIQFYGETLADSEIRRLCDHVYEFSVCSDRRRQETSEQRDYEKRMKRHV